MTCPACGAGPVSVLKSLDSDVFIQRRRTCRCGARWTTEERLIRGTVVTGRGSFEGPLAAASDQVSSHSRQQMQLEAPNKPPNGKGESLSDPIRSGPISLPGFEASDPDLSSGSDQEATKPRKRGPNRECTAPFEDCWKQYGRKEEKGAAFDAWRIAARQVGGEDNLRVLVLDALKWQAPIWAADGWKFAKYFEGYLKKRRWEDQPSAAGPTTKVAKQFEEHKAMWAAGQEWAAGGAK